MSTPKFKTTKWQVKFCSKHKQPLSGTSWSVSYRGSRCGGYRGECEIISIPNVPFKVPEMLLDRSSNKGWSILKDVKTGVEYPIAISELVSVIKAFGFPKGGTINNQWWMWRGVGGGAKTITLLIDE